MRPRVSRLLRYHVVGLWIVIAAVLYYLSQLSGYQRATKDIGYGQNRSIGTLATATSDGQGSKSETTTNRSADLTNDSLGRFGGVDKEPGARERASHPFEDRRKPLETERVVAPPGVSPSAAERLRFARDLGAESESSALLDIPQHPSTSDPHRHSINTNLPLIKGALVLHSNAMNVGDYWLVPKDLRPNGAIMVRVWPFAITKVNDKFCISVHSIDDGRDYAVTTEGAWLNK